MTANHPFKDLGLSAKLLQAITELGYENPTPIQAKSIPVMLSGSDLMAEAETGTGKTGAFALPILMNLDTSIKAPQALILTPTRELAIQVAEAFTMYAKHLSEFYVLPIYGGQDYTRQIKALKRGVQVVVGTPGRVMDHMRRQTLSLANITTLVLDEADEMLKMGFQEDVEWILEHMPEEFQTVLFSATLSKNVQKIAAKYLNNPEKIHIKAQASQLPSINQSYAIVPQEHKLDTLTRFLEVEAFDAAIIFARTKNATVELTEKLQARGYIAAALNGDIKQRQRELVIEDTKSGKIDIIVATDVAARGLDVERISFVVNYDLPNDTESYVHRIGRTGRAGRKGNSLLFVTPRERRFFKDMERAISQPIHLVEPPTDDEVQARRQDEFVAKIDHATQHKHFDVYRKLVDHIKQHTDMPELDIAASLALMHADAQEIVRLSQKATRVKPVQTQQSTATKSRQKPNSDQDKRRSKPRERR
jgi:ATP-dependent RNA helicase DeaD